MQYVGRIFGLILLLNLVACAGQKFGDIASESPSDSESPAVAASSSEPASGVVLTTVEFRGASD